MKYFREYPWGLQLLLFLLMCFTMMWFGVSMIMILLPKFAGIDYRQLEHVNEQSPVALVNIDILVQGFLNLSSFFIPAFLFAYLAHPRPAGYLGFRMPGKSIQLLLVVLLMLGATPVLMMIEGLVSQINFGPGIKKLQADSESTMTAFLNINTLSGFIKVFAMLAIVPAFSEELFFRGVFMRFIRKRGRNMVMSIIASASVFAFMHFNVYGFLSIFSAGLLLAAIYYLTGSIWCSIIGHMFFNGLQIILSYAGNTNAAVKTFISSNTVPYYLVIGGALVAGLSFYLLLKNKTPLPDSWTDDFTPEELAVKADTDNSATSG